MSVGRKSTTPPGQSPPPPKTRDQDPANRTNFGQQAHKPRPCNYLGGAAESPPSPVLLFNYQKPPGHPSAQVLRMLRTYQALPAAYLERPLRLRSLPLASGKHPRPFSRGLRANRHCSQRSGDRLTTSKQTAATKRSIVGSIGRANPEISRFYWASPLKVGAKTKAPSPRRRLRQLLVPPSLAATPGSPNQGPPTATSLGTQPNENPQVPTSKCGKLTDRCKTTTDVA